MGIADSPFLFSSNKTQLVALGCPTLGFFVDGEGQYVSGCMSVCRPPHYDLPGPCTGVGCCRSAIPKGVNFFEPYLDTLSREQIRYQTIAVLTTPCHYVFLVQTDWLDSGHIILNRTDDFEVPVVLDWAIRNVGNCSAAEGNVMADFACLSANSECFDVDNGDGYRCNCSTGYHGNPYIDGVGGCIGKQNGHTTLNFSCLEQRPSGY
jgi:hypothetical protein